MELPPAQWFEQKLDHSSPSDQRTWKQRYFVNDSFYDFKNPGPVFLMIGGEGPADARWMVKGAWIEYAKYFKALCINLEHRYYGESHPLGDLSVKNMSYLSSGQALSDLAYFISAMNAKYRLTSDVKWVAFGGSYPGSLAAWLRMKYPHLVHAAVSSSGPLLAKVNFMEYFKVVVDALRKYDDDRHNDDGACVEELKKAHEQIEMMIKVHPEDIEKEYRVCKPFADANKNDMKTFYNAIADGFADLVQYNKDNRIGADEKYKNLTIDTVCKMMNDKTGKMPAYKKLAKFNSINLEKSKEKCLDYSYQNMIDELRNTSYGEGARQWMYQTCTEFGFYQTSSAEVEVFGSHIDLQYYIQQCQDVFGNKYNEKFITEAADWTNSKYGALDIAVTRVVFVHGSVDPWHALGITHTQDEDAPAIYIEGTAHCANMYPPSKDDVEALKEARVEVKQYLTTWLI
ncbi:hypothetical protein O0L34_g2531 [Tuta absoluta]|nr:hypothetical protein O0L34_g2531 [Tuta absoluta]